MFQKSTKTLQILCIIVGSLSLLAGCSTPETSKPADVKIEKSSSTKTKKSTTQSSKVEKTIETTSQSIEQPKQDTIDIQQVNQQLKTLHQFTYASGEKFDKTIGNLQKMHINVSINTKSYYNKYEFSGRGNNGIILASIITKDNIEDQGSKILFHYDFRYAISPTSNKISLDVIGKNVQDALKDDKQYQPITKHVTYQLILNDSKISGDLTILNTEWMNA